MYKGMKHFTNKKLNKLMLGSFAIVIILLDIGLIRIHYNNYQEKINILSQIVSNEDTLNKVTGILKNGSVRNKVTGKEILGHKEVLKDKKLLERQKIQEIQEIQEILRGKEILKEYGYNLDRDNVFYYQFQREYVLIIAVSLAVLLFSLGILIIIDRSNKKKFHIESQLIEQLIIDYKQGIVKEYRNEKEPLENKQINFDHENMQSLYDEVRTLGDTLKLLNQREADEKEATKSLVADISHQLKTPLAALKTSFDVLKLKLTPEERAEFMERCNIQILGIENLLGALINISRLEAGVIEIKLEQMCIFDTIVYAINRIYVKAEEKGIQIELGAEEVLKELFLPHDKKWLSEAFINIFENAVKYSPTNTKISISMTNMVSFLRIEICDEGIGIPKEEYNHIFKRFYRGNSTIVKTQIGSGIGLYLSREIIGRHHGTIRVDTRIDRQSGSRFIIQLPLQ